MTPETEATERLNAAAHDLLTALKIAALTLETVHLSDPKNIAAKCAAFRARQAIAKAEKPPTP